MITMVTREIRAHGTIINIWVVRIIRIKRISRAIHIIRVMRFIGIFG